MFIVYHKNARHKKTRSAILAKRVLDLRAWQFPTFTWQTATL